MAEYRVVVKYRLFLVFCLALLAGLLPVFLLGKPAQGAATLPNGFSQSLVTAGLSNPTAMAFAPDGRLFVAEQGGKLRVIKNGQLLPSPFVDLTSITDSTGERGLLGIAFDPNFSTNKFVYVYHTLKGTATRNPYNRVVRFTASGDAAVPQSAKLILYLNDLSATNHNGGAIHFGKDGKLYVGVGENAVKSNAQSTANLLGKMLRINKDSTIPTDNPFYANPKVVGKNKAIWALGLRNPYSFAVQPGTGQIFINDVGQSTWEEINRGARGANYGWPVREGPCAIGSTTNCGVVAGYVNPIFAYRHGTTDCAITGGTFYNPRVANFPARYVGDYFFADLCSGFIRVRDASSGAVSGFATGLSNPVDLQVGPNGALYYLERGTGSVSAIKYNG
jgi:glucose/arabinose dehydrogenase